MACLGADGTVTRFAASPAMNSINGRHPHELVSGGRRHRVGRPSISAAAGVVMAVIASMVLALAPPASADVDLWGNNQRLRFYGTKLNGDLFDGRSLIGRPAVMWFWTPAPYCPVCIQEAPVIAAVAKAHPEVTFVGVAGRWDAMSMQRVVNDFGLDFTNLTDPNGMVWQAFIVPWPPAWAFLRPDGTGYLVNNVGSPMSEQELTDRVMALTAPAPPAS